MKTKRVAIAAAALSLSLLAGVASAAGVTNRSPSDPGQANGLMTACAAMHDTPAMERMHAAMPPQAQAQHDAMHAQMAGMMGGAGMMG